ncbi:MAG: hypothetical protein SF052_22830 [Bacteroidia bacterium]|nr:hypothetical protein [Bacteroidia bacterium]
MKFLTKNKDSAVLQQGLTYQKDKSKNNQRLREMLISEQKNFCAYTEKYLNGMDTVDVEHFDSSLKYKDDYFNYYAVLSKANQYKKDEKYKDAPFFKNRFFQNKDEFDFRVRYVKGGDYEEVDLNDTEAQELIDFLGFNHEFLHRDRKKHIKRLDGLFKDANWNTEKQIEYFQQNRSELSFLTALEVELELDLSKFYQNPPQPHDS